MPPTYNYHKLKAVLEEKGLSQAQLATLVAERYNLKRGTIQKMVSDFCNPYALQKKRSTHYIDKICTVLDIPKEKVYDNWDNGVPAKNKPSVFDWSEKD